MVLTTGELIDPQNVLVDNFKSKFNKNIWSTKRIEEDRLSFNVVDGVPSVGITIHKGDKPEGITERSEISEKSNIRLPLGIDAFYGFSVFLPTNFLVNNNRLVLAQWKEITEKPESPFLSIRYVDGMMFAQVNGDNVKEKYPISSDARGQWMNFNVGYKVLDSGLGVCNMVVNGNEVLNHSGQIGYKNPKEGRTYFKMGIYRDSIDQPQTAFFANFRRGHTA